VCESEVPCHLQFCRIFKYTFVPNFASCFIYLFSSLTWESTWNIHTKRSTTFAHGRAGM